MTLRISDLYDTYRLNGLGLNSAETESAVLSEIYANPVTVDAGLQVSLNRIKHDAALTEDGRKAARLKAGQDARKKLRAWLDPRVAGIEGAIKERLAKLWAAANPPSAPATDAGARIEAAMLRAEVRRQAEGLPLEGVAELYRRGGPIVRAALDELPRIHGDQHGSVQIDAFASPELREQVAIDEGGRIVPTVAAELQDLRAIRDFLTSAASVLERSIDADAGAVAQPPIVR